MSKNNILKIDESLPQIVLSESKNTLFIDWYNSDLRFEHSIPKAFNQGYIKIELSSFTYDSNKPETKQLISEVAKSYNTTYRKAEEVVVNSFSAIRMIILYFEFVRDDFVIGAIYNNNNQLMSKFKIQTGNATDDPITLIAPEDRFKVSGEELQENFNRYVIALFSACMWYLCTTTKTTKYVYTVEKPKYKYTNKTILDVNKVKTISTPIYDLSKIRYKNIDRLIQRKQGWTYSHSFQVHGHYRHYKDGKVIFVQSYIKGKDKPLQNQEIIINPKE